MSTDTLRVFSLDGGPHPILTLLQLRDLAHQLHHDGKPGILQSTDVFVGNSAGALTAMYLSYTLQNQPDLSEVEIFEAAWKFMVQILESTSGTPKTLLTMLEGQTAAIDPTELTQVLTDTFGEAKFSELEHLMCVTSYDLLNPTHAQVLSNFDAGPQYESPRGDLRDQSIVDTGLQSGAFPLVLPLHQSRIDGAFASNNPAMLGLTQLIAAARIATTPPLAGRSFDQMAMFSLGTDDAGFTGSVFPADDENWGWIRWLGPHFCSWAKLPDEEIVDEISKIWNDDLIDMDLRLLLLVSALIYGNSQAIRRQCQQILPEGQFFRLALPMKKSIGEMMLSTLIGQEQKIVESAQEEAEAWKAGQLHSDPYNPSFETAYQWLESVWVKSS